MSCENAAPVDCAAESATARRKAVEQQRLAAESAKRAAAFAARGSKWLADFERETARRHIAAAVAYDAAASIYEELA